MDFPEFRCFAEVERLEPGDLVLSLEESRHLLQARRAVSGTEVMILNGRGDRATGTLSHCGKKEAVISVRQVGRIPPPAPSLTLFVGGLKQSAWDEVLRYAGELGVNRLVWLQSDYAVAELKEDRIADKKRRWRDKMIQSLKQCGNPHLPEVSVCFSLEESLRVGGSRFVAALYGNPAPASEALSASRGADLHIWIGPEGDFSPREYALLAEAGVSPMSLGPRILRAETAVLAIATLVRMG